MFERIINVTTSERFPFDIFYETKGQILCFRKGKKIFPEIYSMISEMSIFIFAVTRLLIVGARKFFYYQKCLACCKYLWHDIGGSGLIWRASPVSTQTKCLCMTLYYFQPQPAATTTTREKTTKLWLGITLPKVYLTTMVVGLPHPKNVHTTLEVKWKRLSPCKKQSRQTAFPHNFSSTNLPLNSFHCAPKIQCLNLALLFFLTSSVRQTLLSLSAI